MKKVKLFAAVLAAGALLSACNKETNYGGEDSVPEGLPTYASITVDVNNIGTRAVTRATASLDEEKAIQKVQILIFDKSGVLETASQDLTVDGTNKLTQTIETTTGQKTIMAVVNRGSFVSATVGMSLKDFKAQLITAAADGTGNSAVQIAAEDNFLMLGSTNATLEQKGEGEVNSVTVKVSRAAAKSQLLFKNTVTTSTSFQPENVAVSFSDARSQLAQIRYKMYTWLDAAAPLYSDAQDTMPEGDPKVAVTAWTEDNTNDGAHWIAAQTENFDTTGSTFGNAHYATENYNQNPQMNNTTCMIVRLKATPTTWSSADGTESGDGTFYAVVKYNTNSSADQNYQNFVSYYGIYKDNATATAAKEAITDGKDFYGILEFTSGYCYYRLNLRDITAEETSDRYSVLRNHFYRVTVSEINNIGWNDPSDLIDPDDDRPVEAETSLEVTISVEDWIDVDMNESLG